MTSRFINVLACHSEMSFLAIEESLLLVVLNHEISRRSYLRSVEMTSRLVNALAYHSAMSLFGRLRNLFVSCSKSKDCFNRTSFAMTLQSSIKSQDLKPTYFYFSQKFKRLLHPQFFLNDVLF